MKTKLIIVILIVLIAETIIPNFIYAADFTSRLDDLEVNTQTFQEVRESYTVDAWNKLKDEAKADLRSESGRKTKQLRETFSLGAAMGATLGTVILLPIAVVSAVLTLTVRGADDLLIRGDTVTAWDPSRRAQVGTVGGYSINFFTIEDTVFGKIELFDTDYFLPNKNDNRVNVALKETVAVFYYIAKVLAVVMGLAMLIYLGIRMAISTVASEMARYKDMLKDWLVSMFLIFTLPYVIGIINMVADTITSVFALANRSGGFEISILWQTLNMLNITTGWSYVAMICMYIVITFYQIKFFLMYTYRLLAMGFLIVISPLITITYSATKTKISKKAGKASVFQNWFKEYMTNAFIQPIHAGIYLFFIASANEIFKVAPFLAVLFFAMLSRAEGIVKNILGMTKNSSLGQMSDYLPIKKKKKS